jgi:hypothetical protein
LLVESWNARSQAWNVRIEAWNAGIEAWNADFGGILYLSTYWL